jgi:Bacterial Ig domain/Protein of unknown function (DUF642)/Divergent InlB B-repeat domain
MHFIKRFVISCGILLVSSGILKAASFTWTGSASTDWFNTNNWNPKAIPGPTDTAVINSGTANVGSSATNVGTLNLSGGTLNGSGSLVISNAFNWSGGSLGGNLTISSNATFNLSGTGVRDLPSATLVNYGTAVWTGGQMRGNGSTVITNAGLWISQTDDQINNAYGGTPTFYNSGTFRKTTTTGNSYFSGINFIGSGIVEVQTGTLNFNGGGTFGGSYSAANGSALKLNGGGSLQGTFSSATGADINLTAGAFSYTSALNFSGPGICRITGGSLTLTNDVIPNLQLAGGSITLSPTFQNGSITNLTLLGATLNTTNSVTGILNWNGTINGALTIASGAVCNWTNGRFGGSLIISTNAVLNLSGGNSKDLPDSTLVNNGTVNWSGGHVRGNSSTIYTNNNLWIAQSDNQINNDYGGSSTYYNNATFRKSPTTGTSTIAATFINNGLIDVQSGTLTVSGGGSFGGTFQAATGTTVNFSNGGYLNGTYAPATNASFNLTGGSFSYGPALSFNGAGTSSFTGGNITLTNAPIPNLQLTGGTVALGANFENGSITNLTLNGSTLSGTNTVTGTLNWVSGSISGVLTVATNGVVNLTGSGSKTLSGILTNAGLVNWSGSADFQLMSNSGAGSIYNLSTGIIDIQNNQSLKYYYGSEYLNNAGLIRKSAGTGTTAISVNLDNTGVVSALTGAISLRSGNFAGTFQAGNGTTINFINGGNLLGTFTADSSGSITLSSGSFAYGPTVVFNGAGNSQMTGGSITLINDAIPNLQLVGGTISLSPTFQGGSITNFTLNGPGLIGTNLVTGTFNWNGGSVSGVLNVYSNAVLNIGGNSTKTLYGAITNSGSVVWTGGGDIQCNNNSGIPSINNLAGGVFDIRNNQSINTYYSESFSNAGLIRKSLGTGTTTVNVFLNNTGTVNVLSGTISFRNGNYGGSLIAANGTGLTFANGGVLSGSFSAGFGALINFSNGTFTQTPSLSFSGAGNATFTGGTLTLISDIIPNLQLNGGNINLAPTFQNGVITNLTLNGPTLNGSNTVTGTLNWLSGMINGQLYIATNAALNISGAAGKAINGSIVNAGNILWTGAGNIQFYGNNGISNLPGAIIDIQNDQSMGNSSGGEYVNNAGLFRKTVAGGITTIGVVFNNTGTVDIQTGTVTYNSGGSLGGNFLAATNAIVKFNGGGTLNGIYTAAAGGSINLSGGTFVNTTNVIFNGVGYNAMTGGSLTLFDATIPNLQLNGGTLTLSPAFQGGTITNFTLNGPTLTGSNYVSGVFNLNGSSAVNGPMTLAPNSTLNWTNGGFGGGLFIGTSAIVNMGGSGTKYISSTSTNAGTVIWGGTGGFQFYNNAGFINLPGAVFDVQSDASMGNSSGSEYFNNAGLFRKRITTGTTTIGVVFNNAATVDIQTGTITYNNSGSLGGTFLAASGSTIYFNHGGNLIGTYTAANGATINLSSGSFTYGGGMNFNGAGANRFTGGSITLANDVIPNVQFTGGTVTLSPSFQGGSITNFTLDGVTLTGSNYVTGVLNLNGTVSGFMTIAPGATVNWLGGGFGAGFLVSSNATVNMTGNSGKFISANSTNAGTIVWGGTAGIQFYNNCGLNNLSSGILDVQSDQNLATSSGGEFFINSGLVRKTLATGTTTFGLLVTNSNTLNVQSGTINFNNSFNQAGGTWNFGINGSGNYGHLGFSGTIPLANTLNVNLNNGYVPGVGTSLSIVSYGSRTGTFTNVNLPTNGLSWQLNYGSTAVTLNVTNFAGPTIAITSPTNNALFTGPLNIPISVSAADTNAAISKVEFFQGTNKLGEALSSPFNFTWSNVTPGLYALTAKATDALGATGNSAPVNITVYSSNPLQTTNFVWKGTISSDWFTPGNWSPAGVPSALDNVIITNNSTVNVGANVNINNLTLTTGTLQGNGILTVTNNFTWSGGLITGMLTMGTNASWNIIGTGSRDFPGATIINYGSVVVSGGNLRGGSSTAITNYGLWNIQADNDFNSAYGGSYIFNNIGTLRKSASTGNSYFSGVVLNNTGTVDVQTGVYNFNGGGTLGGAFNTFAGATINFSGGSFVIGAVPAVTGTGTCQFNSGNMTLLYDRVPGLLLKGGTVILSPSFQNSGAITNFTLSGSTLSGTNSVIGTFNWSSGSVSGALTVANGGTLNMQSGGNHDLPGSVLINSGTVVWSSSQIRGNSGTFITNNSLWLAQSDDEINAAYGGTVSFVNNGTFRKNASSGTTYIKGTVFSNNGTVDAQSGTISFESGGVLTGTYSAAASALVVFHAGSFTLNSQPSFIGSGSFQLTGGNLTLNQDITSALQLTGGNVTVSPSFQNAGSITNLTLDGSTLLGTNVVTGQMIWNKGTLSGALTVATNATLMLTANAVHDLPSSTLTNFGTVLWTGNQVRGNGTTVINNRNLWLAQCDSELNSAYGGTTLFINNGTFRKLASGGTTTLNLEFKNNGLVDAQTGTVSFNKGGTIEGSYNTVNGSMVDFSSGNFVSTVTPVIATNGITRFSGGNLDLAYDCNPNLQLVGGNVTPGAAFQNNGSITNLTIVGATLTGSNTVSGTFNWISGNLSGSLTVSTNGLLTLNGSSDKDMPGAWLANYGTVMWLSGRIRGNASSSITNGGLWLVQTDYEMNNDYGGSGSLSFVNTGTFRKQTTYGATTFKNVPFSNSGILDVQTGTVNFNSSYTQTGASMYFGMSSPNVAGHVNISGNVNLDGTLRLQFANGYVPITGDVITLVNYGSHNGTFANLDLPPLANGQGWKVDYGAGGVQLTIVPPAANYNLQISGSVMDNLGHPIAGASVYAVVDPLTITNLIQNGSFELPSNNGTSYILYGPGSTNIPGWIVLGPTNSNIAIANGFLGAAADGTQYFDPAGNTGNGGIAQTFPSVPGKAYLLIFYHGTYSSHGMSASLGVTVGTNSYTFGEISTSNLGWTREEVTFVANSNLTTLAFMDLSGYDANNAFVDNVQVVPPGFGSVLSAITDTNGIYTVAVPNGTWQVGVSGLQALGYNDVLNQTVALNNSNAVVNFTTTPLSSQTTYTITTAVNPPGAGSASGGGTFASGANVTLVATPNTNSLPYLFANWTENGVIQSTSPGYTFPAIRNRQLVANFTLPQYTIAAINSPTNAGSITGTGSYFYGATNVLTAYPNFGYYFANWTEGANVVGTNLTLTTVVYSNHSYVANYNEANVSHVVTTVTSPAGLAAVAGAGTYVNGQTANFSAPVSITNSPYVYTFHQYTLSNTVANTNASFSKTFSTLDPTNLQYIAVYDAKNILPLVTNVNANFANIVPATTNFQISLQFDRTMDTNFAPAFIVTNSAAAVQANVSTGGYWTTTVISNDTFFAPPITFSTGMDGTNRFFAFGAKDLFGNALALTNLANVRVDVTPPANPVLAITSSNNTSITVSWSNYVAPSDLNGFRVYNQATNFSSVSGLPILTGLGSGARSFQFGNLALDTPYYVTVQAVDAAGNSSAAATPLQIMLPSTVPPAVALQSSSVGASSAQLTWNSYNTSGLLGFAGFRVYYEQTNFTSVVGLASRATLATGVRSFQVDGLDRTKTYYLAVVGYNQANGFNPNVATVKWSDPYGGNIGVNTTIGGAGQGVVSINQSIVVVSNATLTIQPGTTLLFAPGSSLTVQLGSLVANGTALDPIIFTSANDTPGNTPAAADWNGVILGNGAGASSLKNVFVKYAKGITVSGCAPTIDAVTATYNSPYGLGLQNGATLTTSNALLVANDLGVKLSDTSFLNLQNSVIKNNGTNMVNAGSTVLAAAQNWWGSATESDVTNSIVGNITYNPFLTFEPLLTPAIGTSNGLSQVGGLAVNLKVACRTADAMRISEDSTFTGVFFTPFTNYTALPLSSGGGVKHIYAQFRSITGQTNAPISLTVNYITGGPVIQSFSLNEGQTLTRPVIVTGSATAVLGMANMEFYVDGIPQGTNAGGSFSQYFDISQFSNAVHRVKLLARDTSANIATLENNIVIALNPPNIPVITVPNSDILVATNVYTVSGTAEPGINIQLTRNGQIVGTTTANASGNFTITNALLVEGANTLVAIASDNTGVTPSAVRHITVDSGPPAALVMDAPVYTPGSGLSLTWHFPTTGEHATKFRVFWKNSSFGTTNQATGQSLVLNSLNYTVQGLANGTYYFGVVGYDDAGNSSPLSALVSTTYDAVPPAISIAYDKPSPVGVGPVHVVLTANEALATTPSLTIKPSGAASPILLTLTNTALNTYESTFKVTTSVPSGLANVQVSAQDQAGNVFNGSPTGNQLVIDTTPPAALVTTLPVAPVQVTNNATLGVTLQLTKSVKAGTTPTLSFAPPVGSSVSIPLSGSGSNWSGNISLTTSMGAGFGQFAFSATDAVDNLGTNILSGGKLELYTNALPTPPAAPGNLAATSLQGGNVRLTWNVVSNAEIYRLYRDEGTNIIAPTNLVTDNIITNNIIDIPGVDGPYHYAVTASRRGSESGISNIVVAVADSVPPAAPTDVTVALAVSGVQISWQEPAGGEVPDHYNVYRNGTLIRTGANTTPIIDYPPRGANVYVVSAADKVGNENASSPASIQLLVSPVSNLSVLVTAGQATVLNWTSNDGTTVGFNVYRNGIKQNASPIVGNSYTDNLPPSGVVQYAVTALNNAAQESPQRLVNVYQVGLGLLVNPAGTGTNNSLLTGYFDQFVVGVTNLTSTNNLQLTQVELYRTITGLDPVTRTRTIATNLDAGASAQQSVIFAESPVALAQTMRVRMFQQTDSGGSSVIYQQTFGLNEIHLPDKAVTVSINQLPLAGGLSSFQIQLFNRGYVDMDVIVSRGNGAQPGDIYMSVQNGLGQEVSRTPFGGTPPGTTFLNDGRAYVRIKAGASLNFTLPNVLVPDALAGTTNTTFVCVVSNIFSQINTPFEVTSGPLSGSMVSSLAQTAYYGTAQTDKPSYSNEDPIVITGQAVNRASGLPMANTALKIGFASRGFKWYRDVTTDSNGNYQFVYNTPPGFGGGLTIWAAHPLVVDQLNQVQVAVYKMYSSPVTGDIRMSKNDSQSFTINLINPGDTPLTGFNFSFRAYQMVGTNEVPVTKVTGTNIIAPDFEVGAKQSKSVQLQLSAAIDAPDNVVVEYSFQSAEGAKATFTGTVTLLPAVPVLSVVDPPTGYLEVSLDRGAQLSRQITIVNKGLKDLQGITLVPPTNVNWMYVNLPVSSDGKIHLPDLAVGQSNSFLVVFAPPAATALDYYHDQIRIHGTNSASDFLVNVYALITSNQKGGVQFEVDNILGEQVPNASVRLRNGLLQVDLSPVYTDTNGFVTITNLQEGDWSWQVSAPGHSGTVGTVTIVPDQTVYVHTRLSKSLVTVSFNVVPVPYTDKYEIKIEQTFETHVPAGVLVLDPPFKNFSNVTPGFEANFTVNVQNYGLIQMTDVTLKDAEVNGLKLTPMIDYFPVLLPMQSVEVPFTLSYQTGNSGQSPQSRQGLGDDIANCISGGFPFGGLNDPAVFQGLAAIVSAKERCAKDLDPQSATAALGVLAGIGIIAGSFAEPLEVLANYLGSTLGCIVGQFLNFGGGGGGSFATAGPRSNTGFTQGAGCFVAATMILMADGTMKHISDISTNDVVRSGVHSQNIAMVNGIHSLLATNVHEIRFGDANGKNTGSILVTEEHLIWVDGKGWSPAGGLKTGDWMFDSTGSRIQVLANKPVAETSKVYTLSLSGDNAFYANGVLVHDLCGAAPPQSEVKATVEVTK